MLFNMLESLIANRCTRANITDMKLFNLPLRKENLAFFQSLDVQDVNGSFELAQNYIWLFDLLPQCRLKEFHFNVSEIFSNGEEFDHNLLLKIASSTLEVCKIGSPKVKINDKSLINVPMNEYLKILTLTNISFNTRILEKFRQIQTLDFHLFSDQYSLLPVTSLNNLQHLTLTVNKNSPNSTADFGQFFGILAEKNALKSLHLTIPLLSTTVELSSEGDRFREIEDEFASTLCEMTNLESLSLVTNLRLQENFSEISRCLFNLKSFSFAVKKGHSYGVTVDVERNVSKGLEFVKAAKDLSFLHLEPIADQYQMFYNKLVDIRREQRNNEVLTLAVPSRFAFPIVDVEHERFVKGKNW